MKRILITGASGFIGSHLVEGGLAREFEVFAAIRKSSSRRYLTDSRVRFVELEFDSPATLGSELDRLKAKGIRFDFIVHNAGVTKAGNSRVFHDINTRGTQSFVEALEGSGLIPDKFLYISSLAAIGPGDPKTMLPITDATPPHPVDAYGKSKHAAEIYLQSKPGFPCLILRPTGVYGPRETDYLAMIRNLNRGLEFYAGSREQRAAFLYIGDLVEVIYRALQSHYTGKTWVVSDGCNVSVSEFSEMVKKILGRKTIRLVIPLPVVRGLAGCTEALFRLSGRVPLLNREKVAILGSRNWQCDPSALFRDLDFTPQFDLQRGLEETIAWNRTQGLL